MSLRESGHLGTVRGMQPRTLSVPKAISLRWNPWAYRALELELELQKQRMSASDIVVSSRRSSRCEHHSGRRRGGKQEERGGKHGPTTRRHVIMIPNGALSFISTSLPLAFTISQQEISAFDAVSRSNRRHTIYLLSHSSTNTYNGGYQLRDMLPSRRYPLPNIQIL